MSEVLLSYEVKPGYLFQIAQGDITEEDTEAIVNAANQHLMHGGGLAAAIVRRGGRVIQEESDRWVEEHGPVPVGGVAVTGAGSLKAKYVIHAVGPVWHGGDKGEEGLLRSAVRSSLEKAEEMGLSSVSLPAISTGIFGYPKELASKVIVDEILSFMRRRANKVRLVKLVLYGEASAKVFLSAARELIGED